MKKLKTMINKVLILILALLVVVSSKNAFAKGKGVNRTLMQSSYECIDPFPMDGGGRK